MSEEERAALRRAEHVQRCVYLTANELRLAGRSDAMDGLIVRTEAVVGPFDTPDAPCGPSIVTPSNLSP